MTTPSQTIFESSVREAFSFLLENYGYAWHVDQSEGAVVFSGDALAIKVLREPRSFMIYVEVVRKDTKEVYVLHEILHALAPEDVSKSQCGGANEDKMKSCLRQLGDLCQRHLPRLFAMDSTAFDMVAKSARGKREQYTLEAEYGAIKDSANVAWERKEWKRARELYEKARPALSAAEQRRLDFLVHKWRK